MTLAYVPHFLLNPTPSLLSAFLFLFPKRKILKENVTCTISQCLPPFPQPFCRRKWRIFDSVSLLSLPVGESPSYLSLPLHPHCLCLGQALGFSHLDCYNTLTFSKWSSDFQFCLIIHHPHCKQSDLSKTAHWVLPLSCSYFSGFPLVTGCIQPPYLAIHVSVFCLSPPTLHLVSSCSTHVQGSSIFLKCFSPPCPPGKLLVALQDVAQASLTLGNVSGPPMQN